MGQALKVSHSAELWYVYAFQIYMYVHVLHIYWYVIILYVYMYVCVLLVYVCRLSSAMLVGWFRI